MHPIHVLTPLTGKESAEKRTVILAGIEVNARLAIVLAMCAVPALLLTVIAVPIFGVNAALVFPAVLFAGAMFFYYRPNSGMRLRTYQTLFYKYRAEDVETFYMCQQPITLDETFEDIYSASVPIEANGAVSNFSVDNIFEATKQTEKVSVDLYAVDEDIYSVLEVERAKQAEQAQEKSEWARVAVNHDEPVDADDYGAIFATRRGARRK